MLHELLFSLLGKPGSIIKYQNGEFYVDPSLTIISKPEVALINQIVKIGSNYRALDEFIMKEIIILDQQHFGQQSSIYRKALASGIKIILSQYSQIIIGIQAQFLKNRHFTLATIRNQIAEYENIFNALLELIKQIKGKRGGIIADIVKENFNCNNLTIQNAFKHILSQCCKVFLNQITSWVLYGKIIDVSGEFFVHKVTNDNQNKSKSFTKNSIEIIDWDMYTLQVSMVPHSLLSSQTAEKILFIGKGVKILRTFQNTSGLPRKDIQQMVSTLDPNQFNNIQFEAIIQKLRHLIAQEMIEIIMGQQKLMNQLEKINGYYLMRKGDFYQLFLQQCRGIQNILQKQKAQKKINQKFLQNTFMRLNNFQDSKVISFQLRSSGFLYLGFRNINQLCLVGNIHLIQSKIIKFNGIGALWHKTKQIVQNSFFMVFSFNFKKQLSKKSQNIRNNIWKKSCLNLLIHNSAEITSRVHDAPVNLDQLSQYICIRFGVQENQGLSQSRSYVHIVYMNTKKRSKQQLITEMFFPPKKQVNFLSDKPYQAHVSYQNGLLKLSIGKQGVQSHSVKLQIKLSYYLNLQMGQAYVGFIPSLQQSNLYIQLDQWQMVCKTSHSLGNNWNDLCLNYKVSWPINLIITSDLLDSLCRIHKFLLPVRQVLLDLESTWVRIPRRIRYSRQKHIKHFEIRLAEYRWELCLVLNNLWNYFQADVADTTWNKLKQVVKKADDFQQLRGMIVKYVKSISSMYFFNVPSIQKFIQQIVRHSKDYLKFFNNLQQQDITQKTQQQLQFLISQFSDCLKNFYQLLKDWSKTNSSYYLYHLIQRIDSSTFYLNK